MIGHPILDQMSETGVKLGLERVKALLDFMGEPHRAVPVIHVAGTNGKGSVCMMVTRALVEAGYRVGTYTSPHLEAVNERFRLDGDPVDDATLSDFIEALHRVRTDWADSSGMLESPLTYFEFCTVLAFQLFAAKAVDVAVVEVGLGGRLDATNVVSPLVCAVTTIGLDHVDVLGTTLEEIAGEKAGIFKKGVPVVIGPLAPPAREVMETRAKALGCALWKPGPDMTREQRKSGWNLRTPHGALSDVALGLQGAHQGANALVALGVLHRLRMAGFVLPDDAIRRGLELVRYGGRIERMLPGLILDGAHNEEGALALAAWLATQPRPKNRILLFGQGQDRDPVKLVAPLLPHVDEIVTTQCAHPKARESFALAELLQEFDIPLADGGPIEQALPEVYGEADETLVTGSLFVVGAARAMVRRGGLDGIQPGQGPSVEEE